MRTVKSSVKEFQLKAPMTDKRYIEANVYPECGEWNVDIEYFELTDDFPIQLDVRTLRSYVTLEGAENYADKVNTELKLMGVL